MNKSNILEILFNKCNLKGSNVNIYSIILSNKTVYNEPEIVQDAIYNYIADRMYLSTNNQLTNMQLELLKEYKYI